MKPVRTAAALTVCGLLLSSSAIRADVRSDKGQSLRPKAGKTC
jgi:hypothetical protein